MTSLQYLKGSEQGYSAYKKYLSIKLHFSQGVSAIRNGTIRESRCSREKYSSSKFISVFERIGRDLTPKEAEMLFVWYQLQQLQNGKSINIFQYNPKDVVEYQSFLRKYPYEIGREMKELMKEANTLFNGTPSNLTKKVYSGEILLETYIYMSLLVDIPPSGDMVTSQVIESVEKYKPYFYYFTELSENEHVHKARNLLKEKIEDKME